MKSLVLITDGWHPQVNGVVTTYTTIRPLIEKRGYVVSVIHPGLFRTIPFPFYPEIRLALFPKRRIRRMLNEINADAVHIATEGPLGWAARNICKARKISFTTSYHTHFQLHLEARIGSLLTPFVYMILRRFHQAGARTMVATKSLKETLESKGFKNVVIWPLGVDTEKFIRNPSPQLPPLPKPVFVYLGRIAKEKNIEEFLDLKLPGTKLIIGDGPDRTKLEKKYKNALFVGYKHEQDLVDYLSICDVFVFPSITETFGLVIVEALACGLPVAAHAVMGPRDIITNGVDGYLSDDLADAATRCLTLNPEKCREKALRFSWSASADVFVASLILK